MASDGENLAVVLYKKDDLRLVKTAIPEPGNNEVLLRMQAVGICGSDVRYWIHGSLGPFILREPMIIGHEACGIVVKCGPGVTTLKPGDRVSIEPGVPCRFCNFCKSGRYNLCLDVKFCATPPVDGNLQQYYTHAADFCFKLPDHVSAEEGALLEPLSVAVHACQRAHLSMGARVLVCGAGTIGLVNLLTAKAMGATTVCVTDVSPGRLEFAKSLGADHTILVDDSPVNDITEKVFAALEGPADITIECSGAESSIQLGILGTKSGGMLVLVGCSPDEVKVPIINAAVREVDIRGIFRYVNCYPTALEMVASGRVNVRPLVTHRFKLAEALEAFEKAKTGGGNVIKVMIDCSS